MIISGPRRSILKRARETIDQSLPSYRPVEYARDEPNLKLGPAFFELSSIKHINPRVELSNEEEEDVEHIVVKLLVGPFYKPWIAPDISTYACKGLKIYIKVVTGAISQQMEFIKTWDVSHCARRQAIHCFCRAGVVC